MLSELVVSRVSHLTLLVVQWNEALQLAES